ncbi:MAG: AI-2E family transporter [Anaerolineae bacterium]|jgi:predicted PurR-regulated permease PerM
MSDQALSPGSETSPSRQPLQWEKPARYAGAVVLLIGTILVLTFITPVLPMVSMGFIFAFLIYMPARTLARRAPIRYPLAVVLLYLLLLILLGWAISAGVSYLAEGVDRLSAGIQSAGPGLQLPESVLTRQLDQGVTSAAGVVLKSLLSLTSGLIGMIGLLGAALFFSFFLLLDLGKARGALADWVPPGYQREITLLLGKLDRIWVGYMTAQIMYGAILAGASWIEYTLLGVPSPFVLAVVTGLVSLIPSIGGLLASGIVAVFTLLLGSTVFVDMPNGTFTLLVTVINVAITQVSYNFIALPLVGRYVRLPVAAVFVGVLVGLALGNIVLAFLIVPILSTLRLLGSYILSKVMRREPFPGEMLPESSEVGFFSQLLIQDLPSRDVDTALAKSS